ncbi:hypothetical protein BDV18DRAFT_11903 [Aspergillus unguis]
MSRAISAKHASLVSRDFLGGWTPQHNLRHHEKFDRPDKHSQGRAVFQSTCSIVFSHYAWQGLRIESSVGGHWEQDIVRTVMDMRSENNAGPPDASQPTDTVETTHFQIALKSQQPVAVSKVLQREPYSSPRVSRQSLQPQASPHSNPKNNYYRQPGCRVYRRVSLVNNGSKSYCRGDPESPPSKSRQLLGRVKSKMRIPAIVFNDEDSSQKVAPRREKLFWFPSRALLFAEGRRYSTKRQ